MLDEGAVICVVDEPVFGVGVVDVLEDIYALLLVEDFLDVLLHDSVASHVNFFDELLTIFVLTFHLNDVRNQSLLHDLVPCVHAG